MPALLITGGRGYQLTALDAALLTAIHRGPLTPLHAELLWRVEHATGVRAPMATVLYEGGATGADTSARGVAQRSGLPVLTFEADWYPGGGSLDRSAGPRRNAAMLAGMHRAGEVERPTFLLAFPGGRGTANMVAQAQEAGMTVLDLGGPQGDQFAPVQRWTRDDAWLVLSGGPEAISKTRAERPGVGLPVISGHHLKVRGVPTIPAWCEYVGRDAHGLRGHPLLANPFPIRPVGAHKPGRVVVLAPEPGSSGWVEVDEAEALLPFERHLRALAAKPDVRDYLVGLHAAGRVLVCWCDHRKPCHAVVIARAALMLAAQAANRQAWGRLAGSPHAEPDAREQADINRVSGRG